MKASHRAGMSEKTLGNSLLLCLFYGTISLSITVFNKFTLSKYQTPAEFLTLGQVLFSLGVLSLLKWSGRVRICTISWKVVRTVFPVAISFLLMVLTGLQSLSGLNMAMFSALRRLTTIFVILLTYFLTKEWPSLRTILATVVLVSGAVVAGIGDIYFDLLTCSLTLFNCAVTSTYLCYAKKVCKEVSTVELLYFNNLLAVGPLLVYCYFSGGYSAFAALEKGLEYSFFFLMACVQAILLNWAIFLCTNYNSALATSVTGQMKAILQTLLGYVNWFGDVTYNPLNVFGIFLGIIGSIWYAQVKYAENRQYKKLTDDDNRGAESDGDGVFVTVVPRRADMPLRKRRIWWFLLLALLASLTFFILAFVPSRGFRKAHPYCLPCPFNSTLAPDLPDAVDYTVRDRWTDVLADGCTHFWVDIRYDDPIKNGGYAMFVLNIESVLQMVADEMGIAVVRSNRSIDYKNRAGIAPNASTCACLLQDMWEFNPRGYFAPSRFPRPDLPIIAAPFAIFSLVKNTKRIALWRNVIILVESQSEYDKGRKLLDDNENLVGRNCSIVVSTSGVDSDLWAPPPDGGVRKRTPILYTKAYPGHTYNLTFLVDIMVNAGAPAFTLIQKHRIHKNIRYTHDQYYDALARAPWMFAYFPSETCGIFLFEARSCNVPVLAYSHLVKKYVWYDNRVGMDLGGEEIPEDQLQVHLQRFVENVNAGMYRPREYILENVSLYAVRDRLVGQLEAWKREFYP